MLSKVTLTLWLALSVNGCATAQAPIIKTCIADPTVEGPLAADGSPSWVGGMICFDERVHLSTQVPWGSVNNWVCRPPEDDKLLLQFLKVPQ